MNWVDLIICLGAPFIIFSIIIAIIALVGAF
jgi:hypothetical protein